MSWWGGSTIRCRGVGVVPEREPRVSLARWEDDRGDSTGWWLVRQIPGLAVTCNGTMWQLAAADDLFDHYPQAPRRLWGENFSARPGWQLLQAHPQLRRDFRTRAEALLALENELAGPDGAPALAEALSLG